MLRISLIYGAIAGTVTIAFMVLGFAIGQASEIFGYLSMVVALSMIFLGIKRYRDVECGGMVKFFPAFLVGLSIAAIAGVAYVAAWEVYLAATDYGFAAEYAQSQIERARAAMAPGPALDAKIAELQRFVTMYADPAFRLPMTFIEIFPVGLIIALISAALLRNPKLFPRRAAA
ncbi:MAG: DUF4199 family protein [Alphaproteobacteria bacterium]|nr:DUF4199 family protein [Alphaproteobacteria bacterium]